MPAPFPHLERFAPILRALGAQALGFLALVGLAALGLRASLGTWTLAQGLLAMGLGGLAGLRGGWLAFQLFLPLALAWQLGHPVPAWLWPALLVAMLLIFGGGLLTRVPLYLSGPPAWEAILDLIPPDQAVRVADLGAGLGGPLAFWAARRPEATFLGVEASPLVWLVAWARTLPLPRCRVRLRSLWRQDLGGLDLVYAFLSPAPMARLWAKALAELPPGALLVSHTFEVPGVSPERRMPLPGRPDACLWIYRIPDSGSAGNQEKARTAENK